MLLVVLASCWSSTPDPVAPPPAPVAVVEPAKCATFDRTVDACQAICPREDLSDWPACIALVDKLTHEGYTCTGTHPRTCTRPPVPGSSCPAGGCVSFTSRVIMLAVVGNRLEVTMSGGGDRGVTTAWTAQLLDASRRPVTGMDLRLTRIDQHTSRGTIAATVDQLRSTPFVLLSP